MSTRIVYIALLLFSVCLCFQASAGHRRPFFKDLVRPPCCIEVTTRNITKMVIGNTYRKQSADPPCVEAIIFTTRKRPACVEPNSEWVKNLIANMTKL
uniref:Chemokine interleukin-8-like domain-containing protein n=1 Tax=Dicentrarchus labrax TaxID=13489 RepID=A0A8C4D9J4_DICLA